jgi:transposase
MKKQPWASCKTSDLSRLDTAQLLLLVGEMQQQIDVLSQLNGKQSQDLNAANKRILLLEEIIRLNKARKFAASSEKSTFQISLFDEVEVEGELDELLDKLPEDKDEGSDLKQLRKERKPRNRAFSSELPRKRIELLLSEAEKQGASATFFSKIKEELEYIPAQLTVLEYWQEKAVFEQADGSEQVLSAKRPAHPLGKCQASLALIAQVIIGKYADGLPLHRQEAIFKRLGHEIRRGTMARWILDLQPALMPLLQLYRDIQNSAAYLQADETRIQVLKEPGKTAESDKWMWVIRGGPPGQHSVLFDYDPSRSGNVAVRLLDGFAGILQADGYAGYAAICKENQLTRIGCWDHARRKFVEAGLANNKKQGKGKKPLANEAVDLIRPLYRIEQALVDASDAKRLQVRQAQSLPHLQKIKAWLDDKQGKVMKGGQLYKAIQYCLNQWDHLTGYCQRGDLKISNALAENAIRPFAIGRKNWLFADTSKGAHASAAWYSLIETAKLHGLNPQAYLLHVLEHLATAKTLEQLEQLLAWNVKLETPAQIRTTQPS